MIVNRSKQSIFIRISQIQWNKLVSHLLIFWKPAPSAIPLGIALRYVIVANARPSASIDQKKFLGEKFNTKLIKMQSLDIEKENCQRNSSSLRNHATLSPLL